MLAGYSAPAGGARAGVEQSSPEFYQTTVLASVFDGKSTGSKRETRGTHLVTLQRRRSDDVDVRRVAADESLLRRSAVSHGLLRSRESTKKGSAASLLSHGARHKVVGALDVAGKEGHGGGSWSSSVRSKSAASDG